MPHSTSRALLGVALLFAAACDGDPDPADASSPPADGAVSLDGGGGRRDAGPDFDGGPDYDAGPDTRDAGPGTPPSSSCADRTAAIVAATGRTITVSPAGDGQVMVDGATRSLREVVSSAAEGDTILLEDGTYTFTHDGSYTGLYFTTPNVTLRSASGDASRVILDSAYGDQGGSTAPITVDAPGVVLSGFTVQRSIFHLIHLWANGDRAVIHDVRLVDGGQQFLKSSPGDGANVDEVEVSCSTFSMTAAGRDNVWGYGPTDGGTTCYTGGIDTHDARDWHVHDSRFEGIYCDATGVARPAHGQKASDRGGQTYTGGLAEHAIHMWDSEMGTGHVLERNVVIDCARGIGIGLTEDVYGTVIRNNTVFSRHAGSREHDVGIIVERGHDVQIVNNTIFFSSPDGYSSAIEYRWGSSNVDIRNNLTNRRLRARDGADATLGANVEDAMASWFVDAAAGDLHLAMCDVPSVAGAGEALTDVPDDLDGEPRGAAHDVGADQCTAP
ncbi:MAG: hypothetical protein H6719_15215 [Sandaracinaceae bacterium]|nr:hypothetical protein [Sandaracinaceae bacterium]